MTATASDFIPIHTLLAMQRSDEPGQVFVGAGRHYERLGIYGGHLLGQALAAAFETVDADKLAHAFSAHFLKVGDGRQPIHYAVDTLRDSRAFATRTVRALQGDATLLHMVASFKVAEDGDTHQPPMPEVPTAAAVQATRAAAGQPRFPFPFIAGLDFELEVVDGWNPAQNAPGSAPRIQSWMRAHAAGTQSPRMQQCVFAFMSDNTLMFNAVRPYGGVGQTHRCTSLDHQVWFHRPVHAAAWTLMDQRSDAAGDGRGMNHAHAFDAQGQLVATVAQESMLRRM